MFYANQRNENKFAWHSAAYSMISGTSWGLGIGQISALYQRLWATKYKILTYVDRLAKFIFRKFCQATFQSIFANYLDFFLPHIWRLSDVQVLMTCSSSSNSQWQGVWEWQVQSKFLGNKLWLLYRIVRGAIAVLGSFINYFNVLKKRGDKYMYVVYINI